MLITSNQLDLSDICQWFKIRFKPVFWTHGSQIEFSVFCHLRVAIRGIRMKGRAEHHILQLKQSVVFFS